jgi:protein TonB
VLFLALGAQAQSVDNVNSNAAKESVYDQVEVKPEFPGGMPALVKYLQENIKYPSAALAEKAQGKAFVRFVVEKDGSITNTEITKSTGNIYLDNEALRVASNMPKWKPGMQQGKPVRVFFMLPVSFKL